MPISYRKNILSFLCSLLFYLAIAKGNTLRIVSGVILQRYDQRILVSCLEMATVFNVRCMMLTKLPMFSVNIKVSMGNILYDDYMDLL